MGFVDLHVHSNASDGTFSPSQVVELDKKYRKIIMNIIILQRRRQGIAMEEKLLHGYNPANLKKY